MKYDDASWHCGGEFPADLPDDAGATHIGMFLAWCLLKGLGGRLHSATIGKLRNREVAPGRFLLSECDGKLTDEDLSVDGNAFAAAYYGSGTEPFSFLADYRAVLNPGGRLPSDYHVADSWENFAKLQPVIEHRYEEWRKRTREALSPAEQFSSLCQEVGETVAPLGYRYTKSGPHITKRAGGFTCQLDFIERQSFTSLDLVLEVRSRELKAWRQAHGIPNPTDTVLLGGLGLLFGEGWREGWEVAAAGASARVVAAIRDEIDPLFQRIANPGGFLADAVSLRIPGWDLMDRIPFVLCFGDHDQARRTAINWLQQNPGLLQEYAACYRSYRGEGLVPHKGAGQAKELAHASHVFGFGDLAGEVTRI